MTTDKPWHSREAGMVLIEALVAFLILAVGILALLGFHGVVQVSVAEARNRAEALALAEEKIQVLREGEESFASGGCDAIASQTVAFERCWQLADIGLPSLRRATVTVSWQDRSDSAQQAVLVSVVSLAESADSVNNLLALVADASIQQDDINTWLAPVAGTAPPPGEDGGDDGEPSDGGDDGGEDGGDQPPDVTLKTAHISGRLAPGSAANILLLSAVTESASYGECVIEEGARAFSCRVLFNELSQGWSGNLMLHTNGVLCSVANTGATPTLGPGSVSLAYSNLTSNEGGILVHAAQYPDDC